MTEKSGGKSKLLRPFSGGKAKKVHGRKKGVGQF